MKTYANFLHSSSTYSDGCYGPDWKFRGVKKRCEFTTKQYKIVCIELAGCMLYGSCPYQNTTDQ